MSAAIVVEWRGREAYRATWARQLELQQARRAASAGRDTLLLVEHGPVVTLGRHGDPANLPGGEAALHAAGIAFERIERGGDITYHGPGQLVGYPIVHLRERGLSLREYMRGLEELLIRSLAHWGLAGERIPGLTGVWAGGHKLAAIGVAVQGGVSYHGFALNVAPDLAHFGYIVPCGIADRPVGSLASLLGAADAPSLEEARAVVADEFLAQFAGGAAAAAL